MNETVPTDPTIAHFSSILTKDELKTSPLYDDFSALFQAYNRLAKRMNRIVRISDGYQAQLQELKARIKGVVEEEERSRLYRDLHDGAGQSLHAVCLHLKMLADGRGGYDDTKLVAAQLAQEVSDVAMELRDIAHQLRPSYLREITLDTAIVNRCQMLCRRGISIEVTCSGDFSSLPYTVSDNLYRIFQEAVANATHHAEAGQVIVTLTNNDDRLSLIIADDGCGMKDAFRNTSGFGLRIMRERADLISAALQITTSPEGTTIAVVRDEG